MFECAAMKGLYSFFSVGAGGTDLPPVGGTYAGGRFGDAGAGVIFST